MVLSGRRIFYFIFSLFCHILNLSFFRGFPASGLEWDWMPNVLKTIDMMYFGTNVMLHFQVDPVCSEPMYSGSWRGSVGARDLYSGGD